MSYSAPRTFDAKDRHDLIERIRRACGYIPSDRRIASYLGVPVSMVQDCRRWVADHALKHPTNNRVVSR